MLVPLHESRLSEFGDAWEYEMLLPEACTGKRCLLSRHTPRHSVILHAKGEHQSLPSQPALP